MDNLQNSYVSNIDSLGSKTNDMFKLSTTNIIVIILILALLGFNIFTYLSKTTDTVSEIFRPVFSKLASLFGYTLQRTTELTATGTKIGTDIASGAIKSGIDVTAGAITGGITKLEKDINIPSQNALNTKMSRNDLDYSTQINNNIQMPSEFKPIDSSMMETGKKGYCFIGSENNVRVCASVGVNDKCMSGEIFPSQEICMNPRLRE